MNSNFQFNLLGDYKKEFKNYVDELIQQTREDRPKNAIPYMESLIDAYVNQIGEAPPPNDLHRLGNHLLKDILTSKKSNKNKQNNAILSSKQTRRRKTQERRYIEGN